MLAVRPPADPAATPQNAFAVHYEWRRVCGHWLMAAAFIGAFWAIAVQVVDVDLVAAALLSLMVLAFDGYGTMKRAFRREPIATLSAFGLALHLPGIETIPMERVRSARLGGNWITGRYLEVCHAGALAPLGWQERLGFGITVRRIRDGIRLNIGCLEQSDRSLEEIEAALARLLPEAAGAASTPETLRRTAPRECRTQILEGDHSRSARPSKLRLDRQAPHGGT